MERIYENPSIRLRMALGFGLVVVIALFALWLIGARLRGEADAEDVQADALTVGLMVLAVAFIGALRLAHYGHQIVLNLDADADSGRAVLSIWRGFGEQRIETRLADMVEWRYEVGRKNTRMPLHRFRARLAGPERWLVFEISPRMPLHPLLRELAGPAVDDFERATGIAYLRDGADAAN